MTTIAADAVTAEHRRSRALIFVGLTAAGAFATALTVWAVATSPVLRDPTGAAIGRGLFVAEYVAVGMYTWWRRPESRLGGLLVGAGFFYAVTSLNASASPLTHTLGRVALAGLVAYLAYVFLCFPRDRLWTRNERRFVLALTLATIACWALALALLEELPVGGPVTDCVGTCPHNPLTLVTTSGAVEKTVDFLVTAVTTAALVLLVLFLAAKARSPVRLRRHAVEPLFYSMIVLVVSYVTFGAFDRVNAGGAGVLRAMATVSALSIPFCLLVGQVRGRVFAATSLGQLVAHAGREPATPARVEALLRDALGDSTLALALWAPDRGGYVDANGAPMSLPDDSADRAVTTFVRDGRPVAALVHDPALAEGAEVVEGLTATALMLLDNTHLVEELRASRARIVATAQTERLRLERNLHDGAQQRLMAMRIKLGLARDTIGEGELAQQLDEIIDDSAAAIDELRTLAHGIYPTVLRERGLADGLRTLARATPTDVRVVDEGVGRFPPTIEAAVYFCALEAIQNATKHAGAGARITLTLARRAHELEFAVADDGGGLDFGEPAGTGIAGMHDRIGAVGGDLQVSSADGRGTVVRGVVPLPGPTT